MRRDDDIDKELEFHVDERAADYLASGLTPEERDDASHSNSEGSRRRKKRFATSLRDGFSTACCATSVSPPGRYDGHRSSR